MIESNKLYKKQPGSMLTDQDHWMSQALEEIMPRTKHGFCIWHITQKFSQHFRSKLGTAERQNAFTKRFYEVANVEQFERFEAEWNASVLILISSKIAISYA